MQALLALCLGLTVAPIPSQGSAPEAGKWTVLPHQAIAWDSQPYLPAGARIEGRPELIAAVAAAGCKDVIVELPASGIGWREAFEALTKANLRYLIAIGSAAPAGDGFSVDPQGNRITGLASSRAVAIPLKGTANALAVLVTRRDGQIVKSERIPVINGVFQTDVKVTNGLEHALLLFPETQSLEQINFWDGLDQHRDQLLAAFRRNPPGPGYRGLLNPLGRAVVLPGKESRFIPNSKFFRMEFQALLEDRYKNLETAMKSWSMSSSNIRTFEHLSRLVPLWLGQRGVASLWDPRTNQLYACDLRRSLAWTDFADALSQTAMRRTQSLCQLLRKQTGGPVVQEWTGWSPLTEGAESPFDGVGIRVGTGPGMMNTVGRATSTLLRWKRPAWSLVTDMEVTGPETDWPTKLEDLASMGVRGWFLRSSDSLVLKPFLAEVGRWQSDTSLLESSPLPLFFPENALNPATTQRLPGGLWWLPSPADGNRIDLGSQFFGYRMVEGGSSSYALWSRGAPRRVKLRMAKPGGASFLAIDGSDPAPKVVKGGVEVTLGEYPVLISGVTEIPIPEDSYRETVLHFEELMTQAERLKKDLTSERAFFKDYTDSFDASPGGSFAELREQLEKAGTKLSSYVWVEAESSREHSFSEASSISGCSSGFALQLRTPLFADLTPHFANYVIPVRTSGDQEVWIAARIPKDSRADLKVIVGTQIMTIASDLMSPYGAGFGWYKLGVTRLGGGTSKLRVEIEPSAGLDLAIDAILITPDPFRPNGPVRPDPILFGKIPTRPGK
ncbi:MAG: hypothetical protein ACOYON_07515 [Fimbriimonas sp.]